MVLPFAFGALLFGFAAVGLLEVLRPLVARLFCQECCSPPGLSVLIAPSGEDPPLEQLLRLLDARLKDLSCRQGCPTLYLLTEELSEQARLELAPLCRRYEQLVLCSRQDFCRLLGKDGPSVL